MKRRNRMSRYRNATRGRKALSPIAKRLERKRKAWIFERLEDRLVFSVDLSGWQSYGFSNQTAAGAALTLADEVNWAQAMAANQSAQSGTSTASFSPMSLPNDPYFPNPLDPSKPFTQWNLLNIGQQIGQPNVQDVFGTSGQDLNVVPAWNATDPNGNPIDGSGVTVAVIDTGVQLFHPDLASNISPTLRFNAVTGTNIVNPDLLSAEAFHGTAVAGIIGAVANNSLGGTGVAPGVTLVPIKATDQTGGFSDTAIANALNYALEHNVDITNNSYGPRTRLAADVSPAVAQLLRDSVIFGRNGLGMINVFSSGNDGGPTFDTGFGDFGSNNSASYNALMNSRYTIGVTAVSHTGLYANGDGTFFDWPVGGASVLVAAPTGSTPEAGLSIGSDDGFGSGITTTDLVGDFGLNAAPLPSGVDTDGDALSNPDFTSRMGGTSSAAPEVSGVIALMLQANPTLTYRDVQEILVRSSRQNAEFESPTVGLGAFESTQSSWQVNQSNPFRNPDPYDGTNDHSSIPFDTPIADPNNNILGQFGGGIFFGAGFFAPDTNDAGRQIFSSYEPQPPVYANGAGYTVSQGYGGYGETVGYAHGVVDAGEAVYMAQHWNELGQNIAPNTELTYTTGVVAPGIGSGGFIIPPMEFVADPPNGNALLIPGGIQFNQAVTGWNAYWNQYYVDNPFDNYTGRSDDDRGLSYVDFAVPPSQQMDVEWVEVKMNINGDGSAMNSLRVMLTSPDGTQSELNDYRVQSSGHHTQPLTNASGWQFGGMTDVTGGTGNLVWTFSTNRNWGENSSSEVITHPVTGEPVMAGTGAFAQPIFRNWELHIENYSTTQFQISGIEVVWHGKPIGGGTFDPNYQPNGILSGQRVQGFVGIDTNGDNQFNFNRYVQTLEDGQNGPHSDTSDIRSDEVFRTLDFNDNNLNGIYDEGDTINQEPFASNIVVDAYKVWDGVAETTPTARFLTGADGNYYFDLDPVGDVAQTKQLGNPHFGQTIEYQIRVSDPLNRNILEDIITPAMQTSNPGLTYLPHYKETWTINPNWFFAPDRDNPQVLGNNPGEIFFDPTGSVSPTMLVDASDIPEPGLPMPVPFSNTGQLEHIVPSGVKNLNFLLKETAPANTFNVTGTVYSDVNGDGIFNGTDAAAAGVSVYWDKNRNGVRDSGELTVTTDAAGHYNLPIDLNTLSPVPTGASTYQIGVVKPASDWGFADPGQDGVESIFAKAGDPDQIVNFFIVPPSSQNNNGSGPGTIQGVVFNDVNGNGVQDLGEPGVPNFRVFLDANTNGVWDSATETSVLTGSNGGYFFSNVQPGVYRVDLVIANEGTPTAAWAITTPAAGFRDIQLLAGGSVTKASFGLNNLAGSDWGDLPNSFHTTSASNGPSHHVQPGFQLGPIIDGEVNGQPSPGATADGSDDGVTIVSNGGVLQTGVNTIEVTVYGVGGLLTGWMDFNNDGHFDESERLLWTGGDPLKLNVSAPEADLPAGTWDLQVTIPANAVDKRPIAARFRWGEQGLSFDGPAQIGEVEDYYFNLNYLAGDYNRDGMVDQADYNVWRKTTGQSVTPYAGADGNGDGVVNQADLDIWRTHFGQTLPGAGAGSALAGGNSSTTQNSAAPAAGLNAQVLAGLGESSSSSGSTYYVLSGNSSGTSTATAVPLSPSENAALVADQYVSSSSSTSGATTSVSTGSSLAGFPAFAWYVADASTASSIDSMTASETGTLIPRSGSSDSELLLLDDMWAEIGVNSFDHTDDSLYHDESHEIMSTSDLALAAVLKEDDDQWNSI